MGIRTDIERERAFFFTHFKLQPNLLVIHPASWDSICAQWDPYTVMLQDQAWKVPKLYCGMLVCLSMEVITFRCAFCIDDRDSAPSPGVMLR